MKKIVMIISFISICAIVAAIETMVQYKVGYPFGCDLSEAHLFFFSGGNLYWGSYPENDTQFLKDYGVPDEACWPYPIDRYQYPLNTTSPDWQNRTVKITDWYYLPEDINAIKSALAVSMLVFIFKRSDEEATSKL